MLISCYCAVYGRVELLREAVESFARQECEHDRELVILNDHPDQIIRCSEPGVTVVNIGRRFHSLGEKWNALISLCRGQILTPWDDDDIHLPWFLNSYLKHMGGSEYFRPIGSWFMEKGQKPRLAFNAPYHSQCVFTRKCFDLVQGYPIGRHVPEDTTFEQMRTMRGVSSVNGIIPVEDYGYIYRWRWMWNNSDGWTGDPSANNRPVQTGVINIEPAWDHDYTQLIQQQWEQLTCVDPMRILTPENQEILLGEKRNRRGKQPARVDGSNTEPVAVA